MKNTSGRVQIAVDLVSSTDSGPFLCCYKFWPSLVQLIAHSYQVMFCTGRIMWPWTIFGYTFLWASVRFQRNNFFVWLIGIYFFNKDPFGSIILPTAMYLKHWFVRCLTAANSMKLCLNLIFHARRIMLMWIVVLQKSLSIMVFSLVFPKSSCYIIQIGN